MSLLLWLYYLYYVPSFSVIILNIYYFKNYVNIDFNLTLNFTNCPFCFLLSWTIILNKFFLMIECVVYIWMLTCLKNILLIDLTNEL